MDGEPGIGDWWGKLRRERPDDRTSAVVAWHPLIDHCADVAACLVVLLGWQPNSTVVPTILNRRLARLGGLEFLDQVQVARLGALAAMHDIGKWNHGFQAKRESAPTFTAGHVSEALTLLVDGPAVQQWSTRLAKVLNLDAVVPWSSGDGVLELLVAAISHHGRPAEERSEHINTLTRLWGVNAGRDPFAAIADLNAAIIQWLPTAWAGAKPLSSTPGFQHGFCGLVQLADWLGSDTDFFAYSSSSAGSRWPMALEIAARAVRETGMETSRYRQSLPDHLGFDRISPFPPRPMQTAIGALAVPTTSSLTLIEEETGGGKTEAALWHYARCFAAGLVDGLYFALPTRTAATQLYARILLARDRCFQDPVERPPVILAVPGYLGADGAEGRRLARFEVLWNDDPAKAERHRRWAAESPKRYLAGAIVVGTVDQALLATLAVDHAHLRATCLLRHLLVVDEVHASDAYMTRLLAELLYRTQCAGGHALLMSATLGSSAKDYLLAAWSGKPINRRSISPWEQARTAPYPSLLVAGTPAQAVTRTGRDRRVSFTIASADNPGAIAAAALAAAQDGARVLIIRNTVRDCLATQAALEQQVPAELLWRVPTPKGLVPVLHHARYARDDRTFLDRAIELSLGKDAPRGTGFIACATQTVQQALDLDADWMITDLCPVDVLLQRLGRLHRHDRPRPACYTTPAACVLLPADGMARWLDRPDRGPHGWGTVYPDLRVLEASIRLVEEGAWNIPADNRRLVEAATHPEALAQLDPAEARWATHGAAITGQVLTQSTQATLGLLRWQTGFGDPAVCFPSGDLAIDIRTRLGEDDRRVVLPEAITSPLGQRVREFTLPARWCRGIPADANPKVEATVTYALIRLGDGVFHYSRLGLRKEQGS